MSHPTQVEIEPMLGPYGKQRQVSNSVLNSKNHKSLSPLKIQVSPVSKSSMVGVYKQRKPILTE